MFESVIAGFQSRHHISQAAVSELGGLLQQAALSSYSVLQTVNNAPASVMLDRQEGNPVVAPSGDAMEAAGEPEKVLEQPPEVLANAARDAQQKGRSWVIILDGLESLSSHKHMRWFPRMAPRGVKLVVCCANGDTAESLSSRLDWARVEVAALRSERCREFITTYLGTFCKKLPEPLLNRILTHPLSGHALWLRTLLEELRLFGKHEEVADRLDTLLSAPPSKSEGEALTIDDLFEHVVSRIELDTGGGHVAASLTALWASYDGLARSELLELTGMSPSKWAEIQIALDESLFESGGQITLGNKFIRKAVADMYLPTAEARQDTHRWLAEWFEAREVTLDVAQERVHNWRQAGDREKLRSTLLEQEVFRVLYAQDKYRLIGHWVALKENVEEAYQEAYKHWPDGEDVDRELAEMLVQAGFYGAFTESLYLHDLEASERTLGEEHPATLTSINNLAGLYGSQGRYSESEPLDLRALEARERTLGEEHPDTLVSISNLAWLYESQGRYGESEPLHLRTLAARERTLGEEHPSTLNSINNLAGLYSSQGRYGEAEPLYLRALAAQERTLGEEHPSTLNSINNLAGLYSSQGRYGESEPLYLRALAAQERTLGEEHPDMLTSINNLAELYKSQGRYGESEPLCLRALAGLERTLGEEHPSTLVSIDILAGLYESQGRYKESESLFLRALEASERTLGEEHPSTLTSINNLAELYKSQGRYGESEPLYLRALAARERTLGEEHPETLTSINNLAGLYYFQGRYGESEPLYLRALAAQERTLGEEHPCTLVSLSNLAQFHVGQKQYDIAEELSRRALDAKQRTLGPDHPSTLISMGNLGDLYLSLCRHDEAEDFFLRTMEGRQRSLGPEHPETLYTANRLLMLYTSQGRHDEAEPLYLSVLEASERTLGEEHPDTLVTVNNLAWFRLESALPNPRTLFIRLTAGWSDPADWKHHWARLGLALCDVLEGADVSVAEPVIDDLIAILGEDHERVDNGREKIAKVVARLK
jgi:hypothetical protein